MFPKYSSMQLFTDRKVNPSQISASDLGHASVSATTPIWGEESCIDFSVLFPYAGSNLYSELCKEKELEAEERKHK